ncbi:MAG: hypothetical protein K0S47_3161 [Herbinix sp.]|jgi:hypothetical protein|nr:hypothetical protein [Herbinix sp.]
MKFIECEHCGASLDFGEKCSCFDEKEIKLNQLMALFTQSSDGQITLMTGENIGIHS